MGSSEEKDHAEDLALAAGCARGDSAALTAFDRVLSQAVEPALARMRLSASAIDEVKQRLRERLLVGPTPGIAQYAGSGPLGAWLRVSAVREALKLGRGQPPSVAADEERDADLVGDDPELAHMKALYGERLKQAVAEAAGRLSARQRNLLRLATLDRASIDDLGALYRVHRVTAARWLNQARQRLSELVREVLVEDLAVPASVHNSVFRLVRSQIDLSLPRLLAKRTNELEIDLGDLDDPLP